MSEKNELFLGLKSVKSLTYITNIYIYILFENFCSIEHSTTPFHSASLTYPKLHLHSLFDSLSTVISSTFSISINPPTTSKKLFIFFFFFSIFSCFSWKNWLISTGIQLSFWDLFSFTAKTTLFVIVSDFSGKFQFKDIFFFLLGFFNLLIDMSILIVYTLRGWMNFCYYEIYIYIFSQWYFVEDEFVYWFLFCWQNGGKLLSVAKSAGSNLALISTIQRKKFVYIFGIQAWKPMLCIVCLVWNGGIQIHLQGEMLVYRCNLCKGTVEKGGGMVKHLLFLVIWNP